MFDFKNSKNLRILILMLLDMCVVFIGTYAALLIRADFGVINPKYMLLAEKSLIVYWIVSILVMSFFKLYNRVWTYASVKELLCIIKATFIIEALIMCYHLLFKIHMPRSYFVLQVIIFCIGFSMIRFVKVFNKWKTDNSKEDIFHYVMMIGAGEAASILIGELSKRGTHTKVICAIDDNKNKKNKYICGVPIVGNRDDIAKYAKRYGANEIIIAMPSVESSEIKKIINECQKTELPIKILPSISGNLSQSIVNEVRNLNYDDLLGRDAIVINQQGINEFIFNKTVLVTGGGGSIGSELCRQIIKYDPKCLLIFDIYENNAYEIQMELERKYPDKTIKTLIGSVRDYDRMELIFKEYRPNIIYHAAAHKHVPLMENSPNEAIKNNCLGTYNVAKLATQYNVDNFILISTDKAVRPTNIMGATKRICEMIIQSFDRESEHTKYAAVRFGNVLGSNGSVIPLFLKQIENGGPVTVTHKDITRFFMTIPEAVSLVLQAGLYAKGGEIFVLDMGNPVKIYDLAENLIRMKGYVPNKDIMIKIIGLRPGEKLYEELLMDEEGLSKTENKLIFIGQPIKIDEQNFFENLNKLIDAAKMNSDNIKELTTKICDTYTITNN